MALAARCRSGGGTRGGSDHYAEWLAGCLRLGLRQLVQMQGTPWDSNRIE